jgi:hypothetical protein
MYVIHQPSNLKIHAFAAQAPGRYHARNIHPTEIRGIRLGDSGSIKAGESPRSNSGVAIAMARKYSDNFHQLGNISGLEYATKFNYPGAVIAASLFLIALITQLAGS